jgi:hypothetical protein
MSPDKWPAGPSDRSRRALRFGCPELRARLPRASGPTWPIGTSPSSRTSLLRSDPRANLSVSQPPCRPGPVPHRSWPTPANREVSPRPGSSGLPSPGQPTANGTSGSTARPAHGAAGTGRRPTRRSGPPRRRPGSTRHGTSGRAPWPSTSPGERPIVAALGVVERGFGSPAARAVLPGNERGPETRTSVVQFTDSDDDLDCREQRFRSSTWSDGPSTPIMQINAYQRESIGPPEVARGTTKPGLEQVTSPASRGMIPQDRPSSGAARKERTTRRGSGTSSGPSWLVILARAGDSRRGDGRPPHNGRSGR